MHLNIRLIHTESYEVNLRDFRAFKKFFRFPLEYYGWDEGIREEKLLEHFIAYDLAGLENLASDDVYVDVAAHHSPWVAILHRCLPLRAVGIDLNVPEHLLKMGHYLVADAKSTNFDAESVVAMSLQCAYEMFAGDDDVLLIDEAARVLKPNGNVVIAPLYLHTHNCFYATAEYFGSRPSDPEAKAYIRRNTWGVPFSRKYSPAKLKERVLDRIVSQGLRYRLFVLRNAEDIHPQVYCHFILQFAK
jgi:hypothetical protein